MLSNSAFNALLKTIEEPPPYIIFIFATTEIHKVPATIRSRCQQFHFRLISAQVMRKSLEETAKELDIAAEADALSWIAKEATGSLRDAYTLFDQVAAFSGKQITLEKIREKLGIIGLDRINQLSGLLVQSKTLEALEFMTALLDGGVAVEQFVIDLAEYFRSLLFIKAGITKENVLGYPAESFDSNIWKKLDHEQLEAALSDLLELHRSLRYSINPRYELELCISRLSRLTDRISKTALVREMKALKAGFAEVAGNPAPDVVQTGKVVLEQISGQPEKASVLPAPEEKVAEVFDIDGFKEVFLEHIKKKKLALHAALQKAVDFRVNPDTLFLVFDSQYSASFVKQDVQLVTEAAVLALGHRVKIEVEIREALKSGNVRESDEHVDTVLKVFRGEIVEEKK
jgi:DNA polymerase-3 subunit gamma/tau